MAGKSKKAGTPGKNGVHPSRRAAVHKLAGLHYKAEGGMVKIIQLLGKKETDAEPIKLLEVNEDTVAAGIFPLGFGEAPHLGIPFTSIIVEITPKEFEDLKADRLTLPHGWRLGEEISAEEATRAMKA